MSVARRWLVPALVAAALLPTALVVERAFAQADGDEDEPKEVHTSAELSKKKQRLLTALTSDEGVLINVTRKELPASPDILNLGRRATKALARAVADNVDNGVRIRCANLLGRIGDRSALSALHGATEAWDADVRRAAVAALERVPDPSSFEPLQRLVVREDEEADIAAHALRTLGMLGDQRAVRLLRAELRKPGRRAAAFTGLWRSRHLMARTTLIEDVKFAIATHDDLPDTELVLLGERAAAELRAPELVPALLPLLASADVHLRNRAVYALGRIGDRKATQALLATIPRVREARMLNNIAFALERLDAKSFYSTIESLATHKQAAIRMNAAFVLGDVRRPEGVPLLTRAVADANAFVRTSAIAALGKLEVPATIPMLEKLVEDPSPGIREEAIYAIFGISGAQRTDLVRNKLYASTDPRVKLKAAIALGRAKDPTVAPDLLHCIEASPGTHESCQLSQVEAYLRAAPSSEIPGRVLLSWLRGNEALEPLVAAHRAPGVTPMATAELSHALATGDLTRVASAIELLAEVGDGATPTSLRPYLTHRSAPLRLRAAVALARMASTDAALRKTAEDTLWSDVDTLPVEWLNLAVRLLSNVREPATRARLTPGLQSRAKSPDVALATATAAVLLAWDPETHVFRLLDGLASNNVLERELSARYLLKSKHPLSTPVLRRALARETRDVPKALLRRLLDQREQSGEEM